LGKVAASGRDLTSLVTSFWPCRKIDTEKGTWQDEVSVLDGRF